MRFIPFHALITASPLRASALTFVLLVESHLNNGSRPSCVCEIQWTPVLARSKGSRDVTSQSYSIELLQTQPNRVLASKASDMKVDSTKLATKESMVAAHYQQTFCNIFVLDS